MKRKHKLYSKPKKAFDKERIIEEEKIKKDFGLKNKTEIWKAESKIKKIKERAKGLISSHKEEQEVFFEKLRKIGLNVKSISEVLSLDKKDYLKRRLQTILVAKKLATTPKGARQMITHKKVLINGRVVSSPSYIVPIEMEDKISLKLKNITKGEKSAELPIENETAR